jgi:hypothetical protein
MTAPTIKATLHEMRLQKRRKGGIRRAHMEIIFGMAWEMAENDEFKGTPVDYVAKAEIVFQRECDMLRSVAKKELIKHGLDPGGL